MYKYFKNLAEKSYCSLSGACTIHPTVSAMYNILLSLIREISFYIVKMKEFGFVNKKIMSEITEALSIFIVNTCINKDKYLVLIKRLNAVKNDVKQKYTDYCKEKELPCETISTFFDIKDDTTLSELIKYNQNTALKDDKKKLCLFELVSIFVKICAVNINKIKKFEPDFDIYDYDLIRFFALTNAYSIRNEKIMRRIGQFAQLAFKIREKYFDVLNKKYGEKQDSEISTSEYKGHCILVSGDDVIELENVLNMLEKTNSDISVYTNGSLFLSHFYPYFKNNKYLKGHFGSDDTVYDFSCFPGAILITRNFLQNIDSLYKGEIFSNKIISFSNVSDIKNDDYKPLIEASLKLSGFSEDKIKKSYFMKYHKNKLQKAIEEFRDDEIVLIAGAMDYEKILDKYKNKQIIYFNCPLETDVFLHSIEVLKKKDVKITVFFPQCNLETLNTILSLLGLNIDIYMANCSHILINPHVLEALCENFKVKMLI